MEALLLHQIRMLRGALPGSHAARLRGELEAALEAVVESLEVRG